MAKFNASHPELKEGEVFVTNVKSSDYYQVGWKTKRSGEVAYDINGMPVNHPGFFPVFAQKQELIDDGLRINEAGEIVVPKERLRRFSPSLG